MLLHGMAHFGTHLFCSGPIMALSGVLMVELYLMTLSSSLSAFSSNFGISLVTIRLEALWGRGVSVPHYILARSSVLDTQL